MENANQVEVGLNMDYGGGVPQLTQEEFYHGSRPPHAHHQEVNQNYHYHQPPEQEIWQQQQQSVMPPQQQQLLRIEQQQQQQPKRQSHQEMKQQQQQQPKRQPQQEMKLQQIILQQQQQHLSQQQQHLAQQQQHPAQQQQHLSQQQQHPAQQKQHPAQQQQHPSQQQQPPRQDEEQQDLTPPQADGDISMARRKFSLGESTGERLSSIDERSTSCELEDEDESMETKVSEEEKVDSDREKTPTLPPLPDRELFKEFSYPGSQTYIGFGNLTAQIQRIWRRKGFDFTLMVVGESGLGKSTLLENLFSVPMPQSNEPDSPMGDDAPSHTTTISSRSALVTEGGLSLRLSLVDTPGFGAGLNCVGDAEPIANYLTSQLERYFLAESGLNRRELHDCLVHCCFFFLNPSTRGLKPLEIECLKRLHHLVNVIPIIGKADTLTRQELVICKERILEDLHSHGIRTYIIPESYPGEDKTFCKQMEQVRESMPYAVIGGNSFLETSPGHSIRVRSYPWGTVDIENCEFSDFVKLRSLVITQLEDMREKTHDIIYETYRAERLKSGHQSQRRFDENLKSMDEREKFLSRKEEELRRREREVRRVEEVMEVMYGENILKVDNPEKMKKHYRHPPFERK